MKPSLSSDESDSAIPAIQNLLRGSKRPHEAVSRIRAEVQPAHFDRTIELILRQPLWRKREFHEPFPPTLGELKDQGGLRAVSFRREVQWSRAYLRPHVQMIGEFVGFAERFYSFVAGGKLAQAGQMLAEQEKSLGQSLWLLKAKVFYAQVSGGLEAQKKLVATLQEQLPPHGIAAAVVHYTSQRNEPEVTATGFLARAQALFTQEGLPAQLVSYLRYHLAPVPGAADEDTASILAEECLGTVVDYYVALVHVLPSACDANDARHAALRAIETLATPSRSRRLRFLRDWLMADAPDAQGIDRRADLATAAFLKGDYGRAIQLAEKLLAQDPLHPDALDVIARGRVLAGQPADFAKKTGAPQLIGQLQALYGGEASADTATDHLEKALFNWAGTPFSPQIASALAKFARPGAVGGVTLNASRVVYAHPLFSTDKTADIRLDADRDRYAARICEDGGHELVGAYAKALATGDDSDPLLNALDNDRRCILRASIARRTGDLTAYEEAARKLCQSSHRYYRGLGIRWGADALLRERKISELLQHISTAVLSDPRIRPFLPLGEVLTTLTRADRRAMCSEISLPIAYDVFSRHEGTQFDDLRATTCEAFLRAHHAERPSQLKDVTRFSPAAWIYFLRYVCTEDILDTSQSFDSSRTVAEERLAICRLLLRLDLPNAPVYESEIKDILRRLVVKRRMREIEESKFSLDDTRIRANLSKSVREAWNRYLAFRESGITMATYQQLERVVATLNERVGPLNFRIRVPTNEANEVLLTAVEGVRDEYVSSTEYGLDGLLSMNVRHGTLKAQLRNPFEANHLVTRRNPDTKVYQPHTFWAISSSHSLASRRLEDALKEFATKSDELIDDIVGKWIRVSKRPSDPGLFAFQIEQQDLDALDVALSTKADFDSFLDLVFVDLKLKLDRSLESVRQELATTAKPKALALLAALERAVEEIGHPLSGQILSALNRARTEFQQALERVSRWFQLAQGTITEPFVIDDAVNLCAESIRLIEPAFFVQLDVDRPDSYQFDGARLVSLYYILHNALENVVRHSRCDPPSCTVTVRSDTSGIAVRITNDLASGAFEEVHRQVAEANVTLAEKHNGRGIGEEGKSGLLKIRAILARDFGTAETLKFHADGPNSVVLSFSLLNEA